MKPELIILVGPPGCGKSTYAANLIRQTGGNGNLIHVYINQDTHGKIGHKQLFEQCIHRQQNIVLDRMNFNKIQRSIYLKNAKEAGYSTKIILLHESKETCIKRGLLRNEIGDHPTIKTSEDLNKAVNFFFSHYERPTPDEADIIEFVYPKQTMKLNAIICDIDGTMAEISHRQHFVQNGQKDWKNFLLPQNVEQDGLNEWCRNITNGLRQNHLIIMCSGRVDSLEKTTREWLEKHKVMYDHLFMRPRADHRQDSIIKEIILDFEILTRFTPVFCIDDRDQVVKMWRSRGITTLQCAEGNF